MAVANHHPVTGPSLLQVLTNGIASEPIDILVN